jgi:hypothetical protein
MQVALCFHGFEKTMVFFSRSLDENTMNFQKTIVSKNHGFLSHKMGLLLPLTRTGSPPMLGCYHSSRPVEIRMGLPVCADSRRGNVCTMYDTYDIMWDDSREGWDGRKYASTVM